MMSIHRNFLGLDALASIIGTSSDDTMLSVGVVK